MIDDKILMQFHEILRIRDELLKSINLDIKTELKSSAVTEIKENVTIISKLSNLEVAIKSFEMIRLNMVEE